MLKKQNDWFKKILAFVAVALLIFLDQITKKLVVANLRDSGIGNVKVISGLLEFVYLENTGTAFGLFAGMTWVITFLTGAVALVLAGLLIWYKKHNIFSFLSATLLLAGGVGNLVDRVLQGYVVDFIHITFFPYIFNVADCFVTVGAVLLVCHYFFIIWSEGKDSKTDQEPPQEGSSP